MEREGRAGERMNNSVGLELLPRKFGKPCSFSHEVCVVLKICLPCCSSAHHTEKRHQEKSQRHHALSRPHQDKHAHTDASC